MPLYEYQCESCGARFEQIRKFSDPPVETCPKCGGAVKKLVSSPAIQFKGTGWYITDYAKKSSGDAGKSRDAGGSKASGSSSSAEKSTPTSESTSTDSTTKSKE